MPITTELAELVDAPSERMEVEYKAWLDLADHKARANLARHIAGLANFGGGVIVLGIHDDGTSCGDAPTSFSIDHDLVAAITQKYLDPAVHCDVQWVSSQAGVNHPIIQVPPHGATPICSKANGPDEKGKPAGIVAATYYLRKLGPQTAPIVSPAEWRDVIRRCALHDRSAILSAVSAALTPAATDGLPTNRLEHFASAAERAFRTQLKDKTFVVPLQECHVQLSYRIETEEPQSLPTRGFENTLRQVANEVDEHVKSGWSLLYVFGGSGMAPYWQTDASLPSDEFLEANLVDPERTLGFDFWRASPTGEVTILREFWEDTPDFGIPPRTALNPRILTKLLGELVWHAHALSGRFDRPLRSADPRRIPVPLARPEWPPAFCPEWHSLPDPLRPRGCCDQRRNLGCRGARGARPRDRRRARRPRRPRVRLGWVVGGCRSQRASRMAEPLALESQRLGPGHPTLRGFFATWRPRSIWPGLRDEFARGGVYAGSSGCHAAANGARHLHSRSASR